MQLAIRVMRGHPRTFVALGMLVLAYALLPGGLGMRARAIVAWDVAAAAFLAMLLHLFHTHGPNRMAALAEAQEEGQWAIFWATLLASGASVAALASEFSGLRDMPGAQREMRVVLVAGTLALSWLLTHAMFALRYAHDWYDRDAAGRLRQGLVFPGTEAPSYGDFLYFSMVLGMTFQVSDVQISLSRTRQVALLHGLVSFLFNTVIVALTVNIAAGLL